MSFSVKHAVCSSDILWVIWAGLLVHIILLYSIFDIYFTSPVVHGMPSFPVAGPPPAKRLVLISADGLRADTLFENRDRAPFLSGIMNGVGTWGVSHTHVPTESRPGHIAMIAGFYEDVSAVARGWRENPVEHDSVFNQSSTTWAWGSTDILHLFTRGTPHYIPVAYDSHLQDFTSNASYLDQWVFERVQEFLSSARQQPRVMDRLRQERVVLFLHLLGLDTNGHAHHPDSKQYIDNLALVDEGVSAVASQVESLFGDKSTAFLLTSDHGMTDWGSHGASMREETETPLVVWGAGVKSRKDAVHVEQADLAPLMSALLGTPFPRNSVGQLPHSLLDCEEEYVVRAYHTHLRQLLAQVQTKREQRQRGRILFRAFKEPLEERLAQVDHLLAQGRFGDAMALMPPLYGHVRQALTYYHQYDRVFLGTCVLVAFLSWMALLLLRLLGVPPQLRVRRAGLVCVAVALPQLVLNAPLTHLLYPILSALLLHQLFSDLDRSLFRFFVCKLSEHFRPLMLFVVATEMLVFSFFHRWMLSLLLVLAGVGRTRSFSLAAIVVAIFPALPVVGARNYPLTLVGGGVALLCIAVFLTKVKPLLFSMRCQMAVALLALLLLAVNELLPRMLVHLLSWLVLGWGLFSPLLTGTRLIARLVSITLGLLPPYLLLSRAHEPLFVAALAALLLSWVFEESQLPLSQLLQRRFVEAALSKHPPSPSLGQLRCAFLLVLLCLTGFFGTGNMASLNSFDPSHVFCFVSVFRPFVMGALLLFKVTCPLLLVVCAFRAILSLTRTPLRHLLLQVLLISDLMALNFFFLVRDEGSWLDIGISISHYVIVMLYIIVLFLFLQLSRLLTETTVATTPVD